MVRYFRIFVAFIIFSVYISSNASAAIEVTSAASKATAYLMISGHIVIRGDSVGEYEATYISQTGESKPVSVYWEVYENGKLVESYGYGTGLTLQYKNRYSKGNIEVRGTYNGTTVSLNVEFIPIPVKATQIIGPEKVLPGTTSPYQFVVTFQDGFQISLPASWEAFIPATGESSVVGDGLASTITATGSLYNLEDLPITLTATISEEYFDLLEWESVSKSASKSIVFAAWPISNIRLSCGATVTSASYTQLSAEVVFSDGTTISVNATEWRVVSGQAYCTIDGNGCLFAMSTYVERTIVIEVKILEKYTQIITITVQPKKIQSLTIEGPTQLKSKGDGLYIAKAVFDDGSEELVPANWLMKFNNKEKALEKTNAIRISAPSVSKVSYINIRAEYDGVSATKVVAVLPKEIVSLEVIGPSVVDARHSAQYYCRAIFDDGTSDYVLADWAVLSGGSVATITTPGGVLTAGAPHNDTFVTIKATYEGKSAQLQILIKALKVVSITIIGDSIINSGTSSGYSCIATFSDGSQIAVNPKWSIASGIYGDSITSAGVLYAARSYNDRQITIVAVYNDCMDTFVVKVLPISQPIVDNNELLNIRIRGPRGYSDTPVSVLIGAGDFASYTCWAQYRGIKERVQVNPTWRFGNTQDYEEALLSGNVTVTALDPSAIVTLKAEFGGKEDSLLIWLNLADVPIPDVPIPDVPGDIENVTTNSLLIKGPVSMQSGGVGQYKCYVVCSDGTEKEVRPAWSVSSSENNDVITPPGLFSAASCDYDRVAIISAEYLGLSAKKTVNIAKNKPKCLNIEGPSYVYGGSEMMYESYVEYDDGTRKLVTSTWSIEGGYNFATISSQGILRSEEVNEAKTVKVKASFESLNSEKVITVMPYQMSAACVSVPIYRFYSKAYRGHFYTIDRSEMENIRDTNPNWKYEGVAFYVFPKELTSSSGIDGVLPVYRFWNSNYKHHFYTIDESEMENIRDTNPNWKYEGVAFRALDREVLLSAYKSIESVIIQGPNSVVAGSEVEYKCYAYYTDGSHEEIFPVWSISVGESHTSISSYGILESRSTSACSVTISANYEDRTIVKDIIVTPSNSSDSNEEELLGNNDNFKNATSIFGITGEVISSNFKATVELDEPSPSEQENFGASVWWQWTAPKSGHFIVTTEGSSFDTILSVYQGSSLISLVEIACNDDSIDSTSACTFNAVADTTYLVSVSGFNGMEGNIRLFWSPIVETEYYDLQEALDCYMLDFKTYTADPFIGVRDDSALGGDSVISGVASADVSSWLSTITEGPGILAFKWKMSGKEDNALGIVIDEEWQSGNLSGGVENWRYDAYRLDGDYDHLITWEYLSGEGDSGEFDFGRIDQVIWSPNSTLSPIYRFYSKAYKGHFFTMKFEERNSLIDTNPNWKYEGVAYFAYDYEEFDTVPVYRFYSKKFRGHFYTIDESEKDSLITNDPNWKYEGVAYYARSASGMGARPVYRFWSDKYNHQFLTMDETEKDSLIANDPNWKYEGVAYYAWESPLHEAAFMEYGGNSGGEDGGDSDIEDVVLSSITISGPSQISSGFSGEYSCVAVYSDGSTEVVTPTWSISSGSSYASISNLGILTAYSTTLSRTVTIKASYNSKNATKVITINPNEEPDIGDETRPGNDNFADAYTLTGASGSVNGLSYEATLESGEPAPSCQDNYGASVWWKWTAPATGTVVFDTIDSDFDTILAVYTGSSLSSLSEVSSDDDNGGANNTSCCEFDVVSGTTYYIAVYGYSDNQGDICLTWDLRVDSEDEIEWKYRVVNGEAEIYGGDSTPAIPRTTTGAITIPSSLGGYPVTSIGDYAFCWCLGLTSVTIPDSVTSIGEYAFYGCSDLTSITIPNSVTSIGEYAFWICDGLTSVTIPNSVTSIGVGAFRGCTGLTSVTIPNSVTSIGVGAFSYCSGLTSVTIPDSVTSIGDMAFYNCSGLTSVTIPDSVTSIGDRAFVGCSGLTSFIVDSNNPIYKSVNGLLLTKDGETLIAGVNGNVVIPQGVTSIGDRAFFEYPGLTSVTIPNSVTDIGWYAFSYCSGLESFIVDSNNPNYKSVNGLLLSKDGKTLIAGINGNVIIPDSVTSIGDYAFYGYSGLTSVTIPDSVTSIGRYAFRGCDGLTSVTIPDSVTSIGGYAFWGCNLLKSAIFLGDAPRDVGDEVFNYCADDFTIKVKEGTKGWNGDYTSTALPSEWQGYPIEYATESDFSSTNDNFVNAYTLTGASGSVNGSNDDATLESGEPTPSSQSNSGASVWWKWTAPASGTVIFDTIGSSFDTVLTIYTGSSLSSLSEVSSDDDNGGANNTSCCEFDVVSGTTYYIAVYGYSDNQGDICLTWDLRVDSEDDEIEWKYRVVNGEAEIYGGDWTSAIPETPTGAITIPSSLGGYPVTSI